MSKVEKEKIMYLWRGRDLLYSTRIQEKPSGERFYNLHLFGFSDGMPIPKKLQRNCRNFVKGLKITGEHFPYLLLNKIIFEKGHKNL